MTESASSLAACEPVQLTSYGICWLARGYRSTLTSQRQPMSIAHIKAETPLFALSIERYALRLAEAA